MEKETITIPKRKYEELMEELNRLRNKMSFNNSTEDLALLSEESLAKEWLTPEEDEAWKDL